MSRLVFTKDQRILIYELISGKLPDSVPVTDYALKIQKELHNSGIDLERTTIHQRMWWKSNSQEVFRAAFAVLKDERPDQLKELFNGQKFEELFSIEADKLTAV